MVDIAVRRNQAYANWRNPRSEKLSFAGGYYQFDNAQILQGAKVVSVPMGDIRQDKGFLTHRQRFSFRRTRPFGLQDFVLPTPDRQAYIPEATRPTEGAGMAS